MRSRDCFCAGAFLLFNGVRRVRASWVCGAGVAVMGIHVTACAVSRPDDPRRDRNDYERTTRVYPIKIAGANDPAQHEIARAEAARAYGAIATNYPSAHPWPAKTLLALAALRIEEGHFDEAISIYETVLARYPGDGWEALQALRGLGEVHWRARRFPAAARYYRLLIERFERPEAPPAYEASLRLARDRLRVLESHLPP